MKILPKRAGKAPVDPRRYRVRVRTSQVRIQVEPRIMYLFALSLTRLRAIFLFLSRITLSGLASRATSPARGEAKSAPFTGELAFAKQMTEGVIQKRSAKT